MPQNLPFLNTENAGNAEMLRFLGTAKTWVCFRARRVQHQSPPLKIAKRQSDVAATTFQNKARFCDVLCFSMLFSPTTMLSVTVLCGVTSGYYWIQDDTSNHINHINKWNFRSHSKLFDAFWVSRHTFPLGGLQGAAVPSFSPDSQCGSQVNAFMHSQNILNAPK